jgi:Mn-containing catalase
MFLHDKKPLHEVKVDRQNPNYASMLQEQLGGTNGELKAGLQYIAQSFRVLDPEIKDMMLDIGAEELSHMEMVSMLITGLNGNDLQANNATIGEVETHVLTGLAPGFINASGHPWTADYVNVTGDLVADLLTDIADEMRAKVVYEYLYRQINDNGVRGTIDFLLNREEAHNQLFRKALSKVAQSGSNKDFGVTQDSKLYFNLSNPGGQPFDLKNIHPVH